MEFYEAASSFPVTLAESSCWLWTGPINANGYGLLRTDGSLRLAHREVFVAATGDIPPGLVLDHICRVRHCVNPAHLRAITQRENTLCGNTIPAANHQKTQCVHGHPFDEENTARNRNGARRCRACTAERNRQWRKRAAGSRTTAA